MDFNTQHFYNSALKLKMPVVEFNPLNGMKVSFGKILYYFFDYITPDNSGASTYISLNKFVANSLLREAGVPVPKSRTINAAEFNIDNLISVTSELKFPLVLKPIIWSGKGRDVICNIPTLSVLFAQCEILLKKYPFILIEEYHGDLNDYRVLVFNNRILDVVLRFPAYVVGNGQDNIKELVEKKNEERKNTNSLLKPIVLDFEASLSLSNQHLTEDSIPENAKHVQLAYTCNATRGGESKTISTKMCAKNKKLFIKAARAVDLKLVGFDVRCKNLLEPMESTGGVIIEVNNGPSVRIHEEDLNGNPRHVTMTIMRSYIYKHPFAYLLHLCGLYKAKLSILIISILALAALSYCLFI